MKIEIDGREVLTRHEAAARIGIDVMTLKQQATKGRIGTIIVTEKFTAYPVEEVERYIAEVKGKNGFGSPTHPLFGKRGGGGARKKRQGAQ